MSDAVRVAAVRLDSIRFHPHNVRRDLGDLRGLVDSIKRFGVMQPVVIEGESTYRLRAGHRRVAAAKIAGLRTIPAVIHTEMLDEDEWLVHAVQENVMRRGLDPTERRDAITAMRRLGCSWEGIAASFDVAVSTVQAWGRDGADATARDERMDGLTEKVEELTREGRSAAQIADSLNISARNVVRIRGRAKGKKTRSVNITTIANFATAWRDEATRRHVSAQELLGAIDRFASTGRVSEGLPAQEDAS